MEAAIFLGLAALLGVSVGLFDFSEPEPPEAEDDTASTTEDTAVTIDVLANDEDPDGDALSVTSASALNGSVAVGTSGTLTYTPNPDFAGTDWIRYGVEDGDGDSDDAFVTVNVIAANDLPVANGDAASTVEDTLVTINVLGNDSDIDGDPLSVTAASATNGSVAVGAGGSLTYTPNANFAGTDTISYTISDGAGGTASASVSVIVAAVNDAPVAVADTASTVEDMPVTIGVLGNDSDVDGDPLSVTSATATNGSAAIGAGGSLTYTPNADFAGADTISYTISDGAGGTATGSVAVSVAAANDAPVAVADTATTAEDTAVTITVLGNDTDVDGDPLSVTSASATNGTVVVETDGSLSYTPNADFSGTDTITYEISDGAGGTATGSVAVSVGAANDAPVAEDDTASTTEDTAVTIDVLGNDTDLDGDPLSVTSASATNGTVVVAADGSLTYTPEADFNGTDTITYEISDGAGGTATGSVAVSVGAVNDAPVAEDDTASTLVDTAVTIDVLGNDTDVDEDPLTVTSATAPNGTVVVEADGSLTYTPNAAFTGADVISYEISDGAGGTASASVAVDVLAPPVAPAARMALDSGPDGGLVSGSDGDDEITGGAGADTIFGQAGSDTLTGGAGDDEINGIWDGSDDTRIAARDLADPDVLLGSDGNDEIFLGSGDAATGGDGTDTFYTGTWVDPDNAPLVLDLAPDEFLIVSVPQGTSAGTSITLGTDPITGDTLVQANLQTVAVIAAGGVPVTLGQVLVVENSSIV